MKCEDCIKWEYFDGYGYGCFCMKTMTPIDANKCEFYADRRHDVPHSWKPPKVEPQESEDKCIKCANNGMIDDECAYCTNHNLFKESEEQE